MTVVEVILVTAPVWALICGVVASAKNRNVVAWVVLGLVLGLVGVIVLSVLPANEEPSTTASDSPEARIERLLQLRDAGRITPEYYEARRADVVRDAAAARALKDEARDELQRPL